MSKQVFVSYSSKDQAKADAICAALERAGIECWIAPRDLSAGSQWGGGIVRGIQECKAVLVVFSSASNESPQVAREMELAVSSRRPLIPVRVENAMPTEDMQFFLGVSHWFDAYAAPIETYLPGIVASVKNVLTQERRPWREFSRRLPKGRGAQIGLAGAAVVAVALITANLMKPPNPMEGFKSAMTGRWRSEVADAKGGKQECILNVEEMGQAVFTDGCPAPLTGAQGNINAMKGGVWAQNAYREGDDTGTFLFQGGSAHGYAGAYRIKGGHLRTRDDRLGEIEWRKISSKKPLPNPAADILPAKATWPLEGLPAIAAKAGDYARTRWKSDAVLMSVDAKFAGEAAGAANMSSPEGAISLSFQFYSPSNQSILNFTPGGPGGGMFPSEGVKRDETRALPADFVDLPQAVATARSYGMQGKLVERAQLENWSPGTSYGRARLGGVQWMIDSAIDERVVVPGAR